MEPIKMDGNTQKPSNTMGEYIERSNNFKKKVGRSILSNSGLFVSVFIVMLVIVVFTTNISLTTFAEVATLGLTFFVLLFCSYTMYINCSDSGMKAGRQSTLYIEASNKYTGLRTKITAKKIQGRLPEFCRYYIEEELKSTRNSILTEVGIDYKVYQEKYIGKDKDTLENDESLSKTEVAAIIRANNTQPIVLTSDMILKCGRGGGRGAPLGMKPTTKKWINYGIKFATTLLTCFFTGAIVLDAVTDFSWATFAELCLKLSTVVLNGFMGYKMGYDNITVDTANYMTDQADLMEQFIDYVEENPEPKPFIKPKEVAKEIVEAINEAIVEEIPQPIEKTV